MKMNYSVKPIHVKEKRNYYIDQYGRKVSEVIPQPQYHVSRHFDTNRQQYVNVTYFGN